MYGVAFAVDQLGDVYLVGRLPLHAVTADEVDRLLGAVLEYADASFDTLLELGFAVLDPQGVGVAGRARRVDPQPRGVRAARPDPASADGRPTAGCAPHDRTRLVLLRHGESEWNAKNLFTGWVDVDLTAKGEAEARARRRAAARARPAARRGAHLGAAPRDPHRARSRSTPPTGTGSRCARSWRLNERHYGALQGKDKKQTLEEFGEEQFMLWRRSYDTPPPPIADDDEYSPGRRPALRRRCRRSCVPRTECLKDVVERMLPYWYDAIVPDLRAGRTVLVAAHGNSLRALVKHLDGISDEAIAGLNIPTGIPLRLRARRRTCARSPPAASTSTRRPPPRPSRRSPTRAADADTQTPRAAATSAPSGGERPLA